MGVKTTGCAATFAESGRHPVYLAYVLHPTELVVGDTE